MVKANDKDTTRRVSEETHKQIKQQADKQKISIKAYLTNLAEDISQGKYDHLTAPNSVKGKLVRVEAETAKRASKHLVGTNKTLIQLIEDIHTEQEGQQ